MDNIRLVTWEENNRQFRLDTINGVTTKRNRPVTQYTKDNIWVAEYYSISEAYRQTGIPLSSIHHCCNGNYKHARGFLFKFKDQVDD